MGSIKLRNGCSMPMIGLGTINLEGEECETAMRQALDSGYRSFDTAAVYGNEEIVGKVLNEYLSTKKIYRHELFITTKLSPLHMQLESVRKAILGSLARLKLDYVDLFLVHSPTPLRKGGIHLVEDREVKIEDTWKAVEEVYSAGLAKAIGIANFEIKHVKRVLEIANVRPHNCQVECHGYYPQFELHQFLQRERLSLTANAPFGTPGFITISRLNTAETDAGSEAPTRKTNGPVEDRTVLKLARKYEKSPAQILLRWLIQRKICVIPTAVDVQSLQEHLQVFDFRLEHRDMNAINTLGIENRVYSSRWLKKHEHPEYALNDGHSWFF